MGYPNYKDRIIKAIEDICERDFFIQLIIWIDQEERIVEVIKTEIADLINNKIENYNITANTSKSISWTLIIANCCVETWLLGNNKLARKAKKIKQNQEFFDHFNIAKYDPEECPRRDCDRNRADTHLKYLKKLFNSVNSKYTKYDPGLAKELYYLMELKKRLEKGHILSIAPLFSLRRFSHNEHLIT